MFNEKRITGKTVYNGRIVNVHNDVVEITDGSRAPREVVEHPGGVCIVPVMPDGTVYLVRQFRYPFREELLELPAGKLEPREEPRVCAARELGEETGLYAERLIALGQMYPTPGYCSEIIHFYLALDLIQGEAHLDPGEFLRVDRMHIEALLSAAASGEIKDAKTIVGAYRAASYLKERGSNGQDHLDRG